MEGQQRRIELPVASVCRTASAGGGGGGESISNERPSKPSPCQPSASIMTAASQSVFRARRNVFPLILLFFFVPLICSCWLLHCISKRSCGNCWRRDSAPKCGTVFPVPPPTPPLPYNCSIWSHNFQIEDRRRRRRRLRNLARLSGADERRRRKRRKNSIIY